MSQSRFVVCISPYVSCLYVTRVLLLLCLFVRLLVCSFMKAPGWMASAGASVAVIVLIVLIDHGSFVYCTCVAYVSLFLSRSLFSFCVSVFLVPLFVPAALLLFCLSICLII